jgi:hypothetical protein
MVVFHILFRDLSIVRPLPDGIEVLAFVLRHEVRESTVNVVYPPKVIGRRVSKYLRRSNTLESLHLSEDIEVGGTHELLPDDIQAVIRVGTKWSLCVHKWPGPSLLVVIVVPVECLT